MESKKTPRQKALAGKLNSVWFERALDEAKATKSDFARAIKMHPSQISKLFRGQRRLQGKEAEKFAELTGQPITEVLANSGISIESTDYGKTTTKIVGWINEKMRVTLSRSSGQQVAPIPAGPSNLQALRFQTAGSPLEPWDGAILYFPPLVSFRTEAIGRWCVVELESGARAVRVLRRGYSRNKFNLFNLDGELIETDAEVKVASPVAWLKVF